MRGCAFTGHRSINSEHKRKLPELLGRAIAYAYERGCRDFYSGGAVGFDTLAAREVIKFRITHNDVRLILHLPCVDQDLKWSDYQRRDYAYLISQADEIIYAADSSTPDCIKARNLRLAEDSDIMICYISRRASGAGQTAAMSKNLGREVYNLYSALTAEH